jgi:hypothetical protein
MAIGYDSNGNAMFGDPVELKVRWVDTQKSTQDKDNNVILISAQVIVVNLVVPIDSVLRLGAASLGDGGGWCKVVGRVTTPDVKGRNVYYALNLSKFRAAL